jgi:hypothetical protein
MKKNLSVMFSTGTNNMRTERGSFSGPDNEILFTEAPDSFLRPVPLNAFTGIALVKKKNGNDVAQYPYFNIFIKEAAARLSDIEMAIYNYDVSNLQFSTHSLKSLFFNMSMPTACHMMDKMEELAKENKIREVNNLFLDLKKIIGQLVQYNKEIKDC